MSDRTELAVRSPLQWTLRLAAPPEQVMPVLAAVSVRQIWAVERRGSTVVLSMGRREPAPRVLAEVRAREGGSEVVVRFDGAESTSDGLLAAVLAGLSLIMGIVQLGRSGGSLAGALVMVGAVSLVSLICWRLVAVRAREADFKAIAQAIDDALRRFKPGEEGAVYRVAAGEVPAGEPRGPVDDGLGIFRARARRPR